jgi:hypothetical protein
MKLNFFNAIWFLITGELPKKLRKDTEAAVAFVNELKTRVRMINSAINSPNLDRITELIPGHYDDVALSVIRSFIKNISDSFDLPAGAGPEPKVAEILRTLPEALESSVWQLLAAKYIMEKHVISETEARTLVQVQYGRSKK